MGFSMQVYKQLHNKGCIVGNENSKPVGGCPALYPLEHFSDKLVVEPSPCTACNVFMHLFGIHCCIMFLSSLWSSANAYVGSLAWQQHWGACMIDFMSAPPHPLCEQPVLLETLICVGSVTLLNATSAESHMH